MAEESYLTTIDNPYDPSKDFDAWFVEDMRLGYNSSAYLARIATMFYGYSEDMSDEQKDAVVENAIDDIIQYDFLNLYRKIKKNPDED